MTELDVDKMMADRGLRQSLVLSWCAAAFGVGHASSPPQRAVRFLEEAVELYQAVTQTMEPLMPPDAARAMAHKLIDHVFDRPPGAVAQELGGVGVTVLALAAACGLVADDCEQMEVRRVLSKPLEHFHERNQAKNAAGFDVTGGAYPTRAPRKPGEIRPGDRVRCIDAQDSAGDLEVGGEYQVRDVRAGKYRGLLDLEGVRPGFDPARFELVATGYDDAIAVMCPRCTRDLRSVGLCAECKENRNG